ncbi:copper resistance protein B [Singulisphaera rosea]
MSRVLAMLLATAIGSPAFAQGGGAMQMQDHGGMTMPPAGDRSAAPKMPKKPTPKYAEVAPGKSQEDVGGMDMDDNEPFFQFLGDRMEYRTDGNHPTYLWDVDSWYGTDYDKLFIESEGQVATEGRTKDANVEVYWNHTFATFWDTQLGLKHDFKPNDARTFLAAGVQGLAPYIFKVDATAYLSEDGDASAKLEVEHTFLLTQRLQVIPRLETNLALQDAPRYNTGSGFNDVELEMRVSYQITRKFAPYVGVNWRRDLGETASVKRADRSDINSTYFSTGLRVWF